MNKNTGRLFLSQVSDDGDKNKNEYNKEPGSSVILFSTDLLPLQIEVVAYINQ
ncbi:hypothetical protein [Pedobacter sp. HMWF019]|uniref:hypothetical protein n=1 Tax=Pedobacter sp. HMWF019 TaxID=2056856 RepID=UPI001304E164|nr:hypothetical protein [Pedobacter sp. HMWF019]